MKQKKLSVEDFYHQFHGLHHHSDPGDETKPKYHLHKPHLAAAHKGLDLKALANSKKRKGKK